MSEQADGMITQPPLPNLNSPIIEFNLFDLNGGFLTYKAPEEVVSSAFENGEIPPEGSQISMILSSVVRMDGSVIIKIMFKPVVPEDADYDDKA